MEWLIVIISLFVVFFIKSIKVVPVGYEWVIEIFGKRTNKVLKPGVNFIIPFFMRVVSKVSMKEQSLDVPPQAIITKEEITVVVDSVGFYRIIDPIKATYEVEDLRKGISFLIQRTIRENFNNMDLEKLFRNRSSLNEDVRKIVQSYAEQWGCIINRVEIKNINLPKDIRDAINEKMKQEKERNIDKILGIHETNSDFEMWSSKIDTWYKSLNKYWEVKDVEGIANLFDKNVKYYKNSREKLYSMDEIKEEWKEILKEDYKRIESQVLIEKNNLFVLNILAEEREIHDIVIKVEINSDGLCTYFRKWEDKG